MSGKPRVLLSSTFKPCGVDDAYGRKECVCEVHHNQLTQWQGVFSPRYAWPSMGTHIMGPNLGVPATVLDWPTLGAFEREVKKGYDYVGISFIHPTLGKFKKMCERVRTLSPGSKIVAGGFGATISDLKQLCEVDHICQGEGIRYLRDLLGQPPEFEFVHPDLHCEIVELLGVPTYTATRLMRLLRRDVRNLYNNILITGLGCTNGCEFCCTSHFYNCKHLPFLRTGREIFDLMQARTRTSGSNAFFFLGDENFYLDRRRADQLWKLQRDSGEDYIIRLNFGSVEQIEQYDLEMLAELDIDHVWIGLESLQFPFPKTKGRDPKVLLDGLKSIGVKVILSSILFLDEHTKDNLKTDVDYHLSCNPEHSQFAGLAVAEGTPLYDRMAEENRVLHEVPMEERHAFKQIWFTHPQFSPFESEIVQRDTYLRDFHELGPSFLRSVMTSARAVPALESSKSPRVRRRGARLRKEAEAARPLFLASAKVAVNQVMEDLVREWTRELEDIAGKCTMQDKFFAEIFATLARARRIEDRLGVNVIQPRSRVTHYGPKA